MLVAWVQLNHHLAAASWTTLLTSLSAKLVERGTREPRELSLPKARLTSLSRRSKNCSKSLRLCLSILGAHGQPDGKETVAVCIMQYPTHYNTRTLSIQWETFYRLKLGGRQHCICTSRVQQAESSSFSLVSLKDIKRTVITYFIRIIQRISVKKKITFNFVFLLK